MTRSDNAFKEHRVGRFSIDRYIIEEFPNLVRSIMSEMIILRAEGLFFDDRIEYTAASHIFAPVPKGCAAPHYSLVFNANNGVRATLEGDPHLITISEEEIAA